MSDLGRHLKPAKHTAMEQIHVTAATLERTKRDKPQKTAYVLVSNNDDGDGLTTSSSLTVSEVSTPITKSTDGSSMSSWSIPDEEMQGRRQPPKVIKVENPMEPTCQPYAQLCFDPESKTLVTLMEIHLACETGGRTKRLGVVHPYPQDELAGREDKPCEEHKEELREEGGTGRRIEWDVHQRHGLTERFDEPIVLSTEAREDNSWFETELDLYLLHDCDDGWEMSDPARGGCAEALRKFLAASKSLSIFKASNAVDDYSKWQQASSEPFTGIGYTFLQEV